MMVALSKGQPIEAILQNSRAFALCQISADDRFLTRKFAVDKNSEDPLVSMLTHTAPTGSPIVDRAMTVLDCRIVRHVELDSDYRIYVGEVIYSALLNHAAPAICLGGNGFLQSD
jgi:flavin reductase (DIM6/NTAB) family NADH-FMN oxidoreductase RutF